MAFLKSSWRIVAGVIAAAAPLTTLLAAVCLLCLGVHVACEPLAHLARTLLDLVDGAADAISAAAIRTWGGWMDWPGRRIDDAVEAAAELVDVPEKLAAVHAVGLALEGALLCALFPLAWRAEPWEWPALKAPHTLILDARTWFRRLPLWVRVERVLLSPVIIGGVLAAAWDMRLASVALLASSPLEIPPSWLEPAGWCGFFLAVHLGLTFAGLPLLTSSPQHAATAGRIRRIIVLCSALPWPMVLVEALW